eukprot:TRINITY_DN559_c0_g1::TRINITY_DN559_c0_g1_i1::g.10445::m.10445 TRINITY_DN559_c0_g1::TRINITY_DN559_c0_g1_i1::g.10445  ORF type:complete len:386 (+),score=75.61,sp/Q7T385/VTC1A_DANRE/42.97/6e-103,V-ATPase_C/PF03223.10/1.8e-117 TRINITY_DN559_c0_g1_i1:39-1160(+)
MFWLVSVPGEPSRDASWQKIQKMTTVDSDMSINYKFAVPDLRVGTLDSLLRLSDDLVKADTHMEATTNKIYRQLLDLNPNEPPTVMGVPVETCVTRFSWDEAKFPVKMPLLELIGQMMEKVSQWDDQLKIKLADYQSVKSQLTALKRKATGSLLVRSLHDIVSPNDFTESEWLTTLLVVVPKYAEKEWKTSYEKLTEFVVPGSSRLIFEDNENALYNVVLFRKSVDALKAAARDRKFAVRDFTYSPESFEEGIQEKGQLQSAVEAKESALLKWCKLAFNEAVLTWLHMKAVRVFVESVLRYGVPPNFQSLIMKPHKKSEDRLRKVLGQMYAHLGGAAFADSGADDIVIAGSNGQDFYPYIYLPLGLQILQDEY